MRITITIDIEESSAEVPEVRPAADQHDEAQPEVPVGACSGVPDVARARRSAVVGLLREQARAQAEEDRAFDRLRRSAELMARSLGGSAPTTPESEPQPWRCPFCEHQGDVRSDVVGHLFNGLCPEITVRVEPQEPPC